jgi:hypothetical protein
MRLLIDSHILIALARGEAAERYPALNAALASPEHVLFAASFCATARSRAIRSPGARD